MKLTWERACQLIAEHTEEVASQLLVKEPVVSVSVVTFNHVSFIRQALDGILEQETTFPFEVLVGDDCSNDGTREIVCEYQAKYPDRIRLLLSSRRLGEFTGNGRLNLVRNLNAARGEFIALLEGDDFWCDPRKLASQIDFLRSHPDYVGSFHDTDMLRNGSRVPWREFGDQLDFSQVDVIKPLSPFHTSSILFHRKACRILAETPMLLKVQSFDMAWFTCVSGIGPLRRIPGTMSVYRKHDEGITAQPAYRGTSLHLERYAMWLNLREFVNPLSVEQYVRTRDHHRRAAADGIASFAELRHANHVLARTLSKSSLAAFDLSVAWQRLMSRFSRMLKPAAVMEALLGRFKP